MDGICDQKMDRGLILICFIFAILASKSLIFVRPDPVRSNRLPTLLGMLIRTFEIKDPELWKELDVSLKRPRLEYAMQA